MNTSAPANILRRVRLLFRIKKSALPLPISARQWQVSQQNLGLVLLVSLSLAWAVGRIRYDHLRYIKVYNETSTRLALALAPEAFAHTAARRWRDISFGAVRPLARQDSFVQPGYSAWWCLELDSVAAPIVLDFAQFCAVQLFDESGQERWPQVGEFRAHTPAHERHLGFEIAPANHPQRFYAKIYARTSLNTDQLTLRVTSAADFIAHLHQMFYDWRSLFVLLIFVAGIGTFQVFYVAALGWSRRRPEYWDYMCFCGFCIIYVLISRWLEMGLGPQTRSVVIANEGLFGIFTLFYFRFVRNYLDTAKLDARLHDQLQMVERLLLLAVLTNCALFLLTDDREYSDRFYTVVKIGSMTLNFYFLIWFLRFRSPLVNYLLLGAGIMVISGFGKYVYAALLELGIFSQPVNFDFATIIGGLLDATCLILGLHYKHRQENIERENALEAQNMRISKDLHDDLGSTFNNIAIFAEGLLAMFKEGKTEVQYALRKIVDNVKIGDKALHDIVWTMDAQSGRIGDLELHMREHLAPATLTNIKLNWHIYVPDSDLSLHPALKKNLWLIFKEATANALRYARATQLTIELRVEGSQVHLTISDDGAGFDVTTVRAKSKGLHNMETRVRELGGNLEVKTSIGQGTSIRAWLPLKNPA